MPNEGTKPPTLWYMSFVQRTFHNWLWENNIQATFHLIQENYLHHIGAIIVKGVWSFSIRSKHNQEDLTETRFPGNLLHVTRKMFFWTTVDFTTLKDVQNKSTSPIYTNKKPSEKSCRRANIIISTTTSYVNILKEFMLHYFLSLPANIYS